MKYKFYIIALISCIFYNCSNNYKIEPATIENKYAIETFKNNIVISLESQDYIAFKLFKGNNCPEIVYNSKYFNRKPFFAYRTIPINIDSNIAFIDYYGKGIDSVNYEELEVQFLLDGQQRIKLDKVYIIDECYAIGNNKTTRIIKRKEIQKIAKDWDLLLSSSVRLRL
ncbi:MAG: hypothetical protein A2X13_15445 [Bacteroidetes bacterium GWC2_33_15]|nr:MAG: hypothetical protein A2X10_04730 [Bacteroidetes bacterium GWA2_33_15]OFX49899.1 MAG: hypothetical protein A2X13_15445 [Bacteroidetes bacterium GWC2_33_15]OFX66209.1 MAG: hypothetical protein A2X15_07040 [Bacteroidetes bacterium GWB2_32_14]OFX70079.1 MAG: hypothetical protein A2X14_05715 [Bacteroidetes bacterium GWD2_33_33]